MNIVYIIGNSFDLNLGLKTSYQDFYSYLKTSFSNNDLVEKLKTKLDSDTWADLEIALGKYTADFKSIEDFKDTYFFISDNLKKYIRMEDDKLILSDERKLKLSNDIISPESYLRRTDRDMVVNYTDTWNNQNRVIDIINFNYSKTIEKLLGIQSNQSLSLGRHGNIGNIVLSQVKHIHGADSEDSIFF
jgi:hypothetical protein